MVLRWIINATGIGAVVLWLFNSIYENPESDAQSATQAIAKTYRARTTAKKEKDSQKREKNTQAAKRIEDKWGFSVKQFASK
jgi:hypothetical protein